MVHIRNEHPPNKINVLNSHKTVPIGRRQLSSAKLKGSVSQRPLQIYAVLGEHWQVTERQVYFLRYEYHTSIAKKKD